MLLRLPTVILGSETVAATVSVGSTRTERISKADDSDFWERRSASDEAETEDAMSSFLKSKPALPPMEHP
jgi:hypothetical protein